MFDIDKGHFSFFDFLGYLIPGSLCILMIKWFFLLWDVEFWGLRDWVVLLDHDLINSGGLLNSLWVVVLSYLAGHIIAFLSSVTVEVFSHLMYGYPSDFLLSILKKPSSKSKPSNNDGNNNLISAPKCLTKILLALISIIIAPVSFWAFFLGKLAGFQYYYLKPLDEIYAWNINDRFLALMNKLRIGMGEGEEQESMRFGEIKVLHAHESDFHRIAYHYEYEKTVRHQNKLDSYIALYDFMRAITFLSIVFFWFLVVVLTKQSLWCPQSIAFVSIFFFVPYLSFMAFMKFYRRHTLETFMCLLTDEELGKFEVKRIDKHTEKSEESAVGEEECKKRKRCLISKLFRR